MENKKKLLGVFTLGIILLSASSQIKSSIGFGVGVGNRGSGFSIGIGSGYYDSPYYDDYYYDDDYYYPSGYYSSYPYSYRSGRRYSRPYYRSSHRGTYSKGRGGHRRK